jgi:hypothetical protein
MKIIVNGCSFTKWHGRQKTWANHLDKDTDHKVLNLGMRGSTNQEIIDNTLENINTDDEYIVLMQLSGLDRILIDGNRTPTVASSKKFSIFNWWNMSQNEEVGGKWVKYFEEEYSEENHLYNFLSLLLKFQKEVKNKNNVKYKFFTGWDLFTKSDENINMWSDTTKYVNINKSLVKDEYESCSRIFEEIDFDSFWFFENDDIKYGGMTQWVQYNLDPKDWYRDLNAKDPDYHPSDLAHKKFYKKIIIPLMEEML